MSSGRSIIRSVDIPVTCDADIGYGNPVNVFHTVRTFEEAGAAGVNIEDQEAPKRCGHMPGKSIVDVEDMVLKVQAACRARRDDAFVIVARTDGLAVEGIEGAVKREDLLASIEDIWSLMGLDPARRLEGELLGQV